MTIVAILLGLIVMSGWVRAYVLHRARAAHVCPIAPPDKAVLVNYAGLPESIRPLRGPAPATYSRPHGNKPAIIYERIGTAAVYKATSAKS
jgi:hypothetical protein